MNRFKKFILSWLMAYTDITDDYSILNQIKFLIIKKKHHYYHSNIFGYFKLIFFSVIIFLIIAFIMNSL
jgi:hypothetical protein